MCHDPPNGCLWQIYPDLNLWTIGHIISFMANWPFLMFYALWAISTSSGHSWPKISFMASGHILQSLASFANSPPHQPPGKCPYFGNGDSVFLPGASGPSSSHQGLWPTPFDLGVYGLNGLKRRFRPPTPSTARSLWDL
ncbi:hypothetical protein O181_089509 [Austropuccinia psidii MF-1]|uniref:Uncharacterized protein n=1 Tax=Austropuccinia psidii MF-1 TaxID=1389203 RepID=A0A9Q3ITN7_9BASI|nr:hypothetical protein [Austropuccinia psidii MF-1]